MTQPSQADIYAALASQSSFRKPTPSTATYDSFSDPATQLIESGPSGSRVNKTRVYCPREGCGSLILLEKAGEVVETDENIVCPIYIALEEIEKKLIRELPYDPSSPFPAPNKSPQKSYYLHVPTPFSFENIGYSRPDLSTTLPPGTPGLEGAKGKVKWLICAECDLGPLGWGFEGGQGGWVDMRRVRYRVDPEKV